MRRSLFEEPNSGTMSPLLMMLPKQGSVSELLKYSASFFARAEKVEKIKASFVEGGSEPAANPEHFRRLNAESQMLKIVNAYISERAMASHPEDE